jgi:N6-adenosine-specific RNA methylase IME4
MGRYRTIVADPPWEYREGFPSGVGRERRWTTELPYAGMTLGEIAALPVDDFADPEGARLFLWTTNKYLRAAFDVMDAWGFRYGQTITWHKTGRPSPFPTSIAPQHSEYLPYGSRGKPPKRREAFPSSVIAAPQQTRHSAKPEVFLDLIERLADGPYVELFARRARFGWDYWGDQSLGTADMEAA